MSVFETERLNGQDDLYALHSIPLGRESQRSRRHHAILLSCLGSFSIICVILASVALVDVSQLRKEVAQLRADGAAQTIEQFRPTRRIAFGSCSSYDMRPQPIWQQGVIPAQPDAWIWLGDMAYVDTSPISCAIPALAATSPWCNCTSGPISRPGQCLAGNVDAARMRWQHALQDPGYLAFLDFMCPPPPAVEAGSAVQQPRVGGAVSGSGGAAAPKVMWGPAAAAGGWRFPPIGTDPASCPRPIFGVYDDHDYGWSNGDRRLPNKAEFKRMFLDAVGEAQDSSRRSADAGLQAVYTLNGGGPGRDIDVVLLDERWYRDPMPCSVRQSWCEGVLKDPQDGMWGWCRDFLQDDGVTGRGSCCTKDDDLARWCDLPASSSHPLWSTACDLTSSTWASQPLVLGPDNTTLLLAANNSELWGEPVQRAQLWPRLLQAADSPVCEVLGSAQRRWLSRRLASSTAALTLVASGSVPLGNMGWKDVKGTCSGDDWNCWLPAQIHLLHTLANTSSGCVVILTGDFHWGDIKVAVPGAGSAYADMLRTAKLSKPLYQVMSSGMTNSTAHHEGSPCNGTFREDLVGLRAGGACAYTPEPNFGMVEVDWDAGVVHLTIRDADGGGIAKDLYGKQLHLAFRLSTCAQVPV